MADQVRGPLDGIRVIDLSAVVSGPFGTSLLADQGAEVVKIEQLHTPDLTRASGPVADDAEGVSAMFATINRNKRSLAIDLKDPRGRDLLLRLVDGADVVCQNFRPGAMERLGIGWDVLHARNPELVMCSVSGFGPDGPYAGKPTFDAVVQCVAGYPMVQVDGHGVPRLVSTIVCDKVTSLYLAQAVCAALVARANGAGGQHIELTMIDAAVHFLWPEAMWNHTYLDHDLDIPDLASLYALYPSADGWVLVYPLGTDAQWQNLCRGLDRPDLAADERFLTLQGRMRHGDALNALLAEATASRSTAELMAAMDAADVPAAPVNTRESMVADPHVTHRGILIEIEHPHAGRIRTARSPAVFSATPASIRLPAPTHGQHSAEVLGDLLGLDREEIADLAAAGVII